MIEALIFLLTALFAGFILGTLVFRWIVGEWPWRKR